MNVIGWRPDVGMHACLQSAGSWCVLVVAAARTGTAIRLTGAA